MIRDRLKARKAKVREEVLAAIVAKGGDRTKAEEVLEELESERPILDWLLIGGGLEKLIALILRLISL